MSLLSNNWKVREEITKNFVHQFMLYASWLGKDSGNITFRLDPKPVKEITTIRPERHFNVEEKMESSYVGRCKMEMSDGWWMCESRLKPQHGLSLRGRIGAASSEGQGMFWKEWACYWITDASPGGKNRSKVETKSGRLVVFIWFQLRMMEGQESECETRTSKRQIMRRCHCPPRSPITQLITPPHPERDFSQEEKTDSRCAGARDVETSGGSWMCKSGLKPQCGPPLWERRNFNHETWKGY